MEEGMFKKIKDKTKELIALHVAGATVRHKSRFSDLKVIENKEPLDKEFISKYVIPFYLGGKYNKEFRKNYLKISESVDSELVSKLLGDFDWRPRSVGAYFAALGGMKNFEENIGHLLLRSDVCYAGHEYCIALASFSSPEAINYLNEYLAYYLEKPDLWFDQNSAMAALSFIGANNGENLMAPHMAAWKSFVANKPNWDLTSSIDHFSRQMKSLCEFRREINS
jgi:hypothetical protein